MDSTKPRSTIPVAVRVASEQEPVECEGNYTERADGFILEFGISGDAFTVTHTRSGTRISAKGVMNYDIELNDGVTSALLDTPFGQMRFDVKTLERNIVKSNDEIKVGLKYVMISATGERLDRAVDIAARLK